MRIWLWKDLPPVVCKITINPQKRRQIVSLCKFGFESKEIVAIVTSQMRLNRALIQSQSSILNLCYFCMKSVSFGKLFH